MKWFFWWVVAFILLMAATEPERVGSWLAVVQKSFEETKTEGEK